MNSLTIIEPSQRQLDQILTNDLRVTSTGFPQRIEEAITRLPEEFAQPLQHLLDLHGRLQRVVDGEDEAIGEFCFACGAMYERIKAHTLARMEVESAIMGMDAVSTLPLQAVQSDQLSRMIATRDRIFRKVADITLKALLVIVGLLILGLFLGVV
jgi:hypothetical protein